MSATQLAIDGGPAIRTRPWPSAHLTDEMDERLLLSALRQDNWSNGELVQKFESCFAAFCGCKYALLVINGTSALKLTLLAAGIGPGDEVIIPGITWPSVAITIMECGADPVPADINNHTYSLSVKSLEAIINSKTRAIIPTHLFCSQADIIPILELANSKNIQIIEDASHAIGAQRFKKVLGSFGIAGIFSFNQKKLLTCGEGGCMITNDEDLYVKAKSLRGVNPEVKEVLYNLPGTNMVSEFQAAVLLSQLEKLPNKLRLINQNAELLRSKLASITDIEVLTRPPETELQTFYNFCFNVYGVKNIALFRKALAAELNFPVSGAYIPLSETLVVNTAKDARYRHLGKKLKRRLPNCMRAHYREAARFHHRTLISDEASVYEIEKAIIKVLTAFKSH